jgi:hypothetical protein
MRDRFQDLSLDLIGKIIATTEAAGIDQGEIDIIPARLSVVTVAGDAGIIINQGIPGTGDPVEQGRFAHVGASDDGDDRFHLLGEVFLILI